MNLTKNVDVSTKIIVKTPIESIEVWGYPNRVTTAFLDTYRGDNFPIYKILPLVVADWNLEVDYEDIGITDNDMETEPKVVIKTKKLEITEDAIKNNMPLWLQSDIWSAIVNYGSPNPNPSNP